MSKAYIWIGEECTLSITETDGKVSRAVKVGGKELTEKDGKWESAEKFGPGSHEVEVDGLDQELGLAFEFTVTPTAKQLIK